MKIYKYRLPGPDSILPLPRGCRILSTGIQHGIDEDYITIWALVSPGETENDTYHFAAINTGEYIETEHFELHRFLGTVTSSNGIVWHIFFRMV